jgi:hypothetical protein
MWDSFVQAIKGSIMLLLLCCDRNSAGDQEGLPVHKGCESKGGSNQVV